MAEIARDISVGRPKGVDRRTVVKGAVWSVPVIVAAAAVPLAAASEGCEKGLRPAATWSYPSVIDGTGFTIGGTTAWPDGTSFHSFDTKDVEAAVTVTNSGTLTVPAGETALTITACSYPGDENNLSVTPFDQIAPKLPLPAGWVQVGFTAPFPALNSGDPAHPPTTGIYTIYKLQYTLPLAPGASAPPVPVQWIATTPRPEPLDYPKTTKVFSPGTAARNYGQAAWADVTFSDCAASAITQGSELFGVLLENPYYPGP